MVKKENTGKIISDKMNKTVVVAVKQQISHKKYKKIIIRTNKYYAHDELNQYNIGDIVKIQAIRPLSKNKRWNVVQLIKKNNIIL
uniref:Small ribosomal subunit protein uS17c n=1 Tax=Taenioma perpusillum TaxID=210852 RepID=A0A1Z1MR34_9FLOR|nr:ribosomal protein S17 [Taenioma perpusillum]ARW68550.1 ribosomal protein S17 [Taenioma perpusillum]